MPPDPAAGSGAGSGGPPSLALIVMSPEFERVHYALVLASAAAAIERVVTLFFTDAALLALRRADAGGAPRWRVLPSLRHADAGAADDALQARGVGGFEELLAACGSLGVRIIACEMGLRAVGLDARELRADIDIEIAGVVTLLTQTQPCGAMLMV